MRSAATATPPSAGIAAYATRLSGVFATLGTIAFAATKTAASSSLRANESTLKTAILKLEIAAPVASPSTAACTRNEKPESTSVRAARASVSPALGGGVGGRRGRAGAGLVARGALRPITRQTAATDHATDRRGEARARPREA